MRNKIIRVTAGIIPREEGKYLIAQRKGEPLVLDGKWEFPGGKIRPGETLKECLRRELREEHGVEVVVGDFFDKSIHPYPFGTVELSAFWVKHISGEFESRVHYETREVYPLEMRKYDIAPADLPFVEKLINL